MSPIRNAVLVGLNDLDLKHILVSVDAVNNLLALRLPHSALMEGYGLEPLRGSRVLERIALDLSSLSSGMVLPILNSILDVDGCCLKYIELPWNRRFSVSQGISQFLTRYNNLALKCDECNTDDFDRGFQNWTESRTCYKCSITSTIATLNRRTRYGMLQLHEKLCPQTCGSFKGCETCSWFVKNAL